MAQDSTQQILTSHTTQTQSVQDTLPDSSSPNKTPQSGLHIQYPAWPTSKRGPRVTPVPAGARPINAARSEQVAEIGYNQSAGDPIAPTLSIPESDPTQIELENVQAALKKRKERQ
jgi:hypothetical protein